MAEHGKHILQGGGSLKWVGDKDPKSGDAVAITDPQQFARQGQDPKEQERFGDETHPGPISEVLAGITYRDARRTQPINPNVQVYAKSKGIIQREYQDEAALYTAYASNPFTSMSEREIRDYKKEIAANTGQDVKEIELIVQAEKTEIKETKKESEDGEDQNTENYNQDCDHSQRSTGDGRNDHSQYHERREGRQR
ncbi:protein hu-li tai shao-like [Apostichopus japonicus]|uniref:protein hu-li tai shao-like n=1 Tax=Stichopus japonicus TaxID=307972 RepID=UPI003AB8294D